MQSSVDLVSLSFAQKHRLKPAPYSEFPLRSITDALVGVKGVFWVPLRMYDSTGTLVKMVRPCMAIKRERRESAVLLGMPGINEARMIMDAGNRKWYRKQENPKIKVMTASAFKRAMRHKALCYGVYLMVEELKEQGKTEDGARMTNDERDDLEMRQAYKMKH